MKWDLPVRCPYELLSLPFSLLIIVLMIIMFIIKLWWLTQFAFTEFGNKKTLKNSKKTIKTFEKQEPINPLKKP
jgi:hypothetical protein